MQDFIYLIKQVMKEKNLNKRKLALKIGLTPAYVSDLMNSKARWNEDTILLVCSELGITIEFKVNPKAS